MCSCACIIRMYEYMYEYVCSGLALPGLSHARSLNACTGQVLCSAASRIPTEQNRGQSTGRPPELWESRTDVGQSLGAVCKPNCRRDFEYGDVCRNHIFGH